MKHMIRCAIPALALLCLSAPALALDVPLTYMKHAQESEEYQAWGRARPEPGLQAPPGDWKLPELRGEHPLYYLKAFGDSKHLMVVDRQKPKDGFYSRLHFDANGNGDLTDDPVISGEWETEDYYAYARFSRVEATITVDGKSLPYTFSLYVRAHGSKEDRASLTDDTIQQFLYSGVSAACMYRGEFEVDGKGYRVMLGDVDCSGRFNDRVSIEQDPEMRELRPEGDHLYLAQTGEQFRREGRFVLGDWLLLDGNLYEVAISTAEGKLTVTPSDVPCLPVKMAMDTDLFTLCTKDGAHGLMMYRPGKTPKAPEGSYRILDYLTLRNDSKGSRWMLYARGSVDTPFVDVKGNETEITFGEPFVPWVEVPKWSRENYMSGGMNEVQLALNIEGGAKEFVGNLERVSGSASEIPLSAQENNLPKEPLYKVAKPDGEVVAQGNFEYG